MAGKRWILAARMGYVLQVRRPSPLERRDLQLGYSGHSTRTHKAKDPLLSLEHSANPGKLRIVSHGNTCMLQFSSEVSS